MDALATLFSPNADVTGRTVSSSFAGVFESANHVLLAGNDVPGAPQDRPLHNDRGYDVAKLFTPTCRPHSRQFNRCSRLIVRKASPISDWAAPR